MTITFDLYARVFDQELLRILMVIDNDIEFVFWCLIMRASEHGKLKLNQQVDAQL